MACKVAVMPIYCFNWGWSYVVAAKSEQQELAFLFILMATSSQYSGHGVAQADGFFDPFLQEHFEDNKIEDVYGRPFLEALQTGLARAIPDLYMAGQTKYFSALRSALYSSLYQNVPANLTLQAVAEKWNEITENQGLEGQTRQWQRLQNKYPDDVKAVLGGF